MYYIDFCTGVGNIEFFGELEDALDVADDNAAYTQQDICITDDDGDFKYRLDASYRDGHYDDLYEYSELPAKVKLKKGDIMYITNCTATFEEAD